MPALAGDVQAAVREARVITREDAAVKSAFVGARDRLEEPAPGYFDSAADAAAALDIEAALLGVARRRFGVPVHDVLSFDPATDGVPTFALTDAEQGVAADCLVARVEVDLENDRTNLELFG